jgi:hypothetical protein
MSEALRKAAEQALSILQDIKPGNMTPMAEDAWVRASQKLYAALAEPDAAQTPPPRFDELAKKHDELVNALRPLITKRMGAEQIREGIQRAIASAAIAKVEGGAG